MLNPLRSDGRQIDELHGGPAAEPDFLLLMEHISARLLEVHAILYAVDVGAMLGELPSRPGARVAHQAAASLLSIMDRELLAIVDQLGAALTRSSLQK